MIRIPATAAAAELAGACLYPYRTATLVPSQAKLAAGNNRSREFNEIDLRIRILLYNIRLLFWYSTYGYYNLSLHHVYIYTYEPCSCRFRPEITLTNLTHLSIHTHGYYVLTANQRPKLQTLNLVCLSCCISQLVPAFKPRSLAALGRMYVQLRYLDDAPQTTKKQKNKKK